MSNFAQTIKKDNSQFTQAEVHEEQADPNDSLSNQVKSNLDYIGIFASIICLIHCLALPLILPSINLFTATTNKSTHDFFHFILFPILLLMATAAIIKGIKLHKNLYPLCFACFGIFILGTTLFDELVFENYKNITLYFNTTGSMLLIVAHSLNLFFTYKVKNSKNCLHTNCNCKTDI
jgi:peptidoglycan biosynthesis protein MviN/MurJ (putative lipid II flippase)